MILILLSFLLLSAEYALSSLSSGSYGAAKPPLPDRRLVNQAAKAEETMPDAPLAGDPVYELLEPRLCDSSVKQHAGFLDVTDGKHLFFWFFESRKAPEKAPLTIWITGGPGGSSSLALLYQLGPCSVINEGNDTMLNPYSWNKYSNVIFIDQPVGVGYSYATDGSQVDNSRVAAKDVYAFLQIFLHKYPKYADAPFHLAAESYGGTYGPHIAAEIHRQNKALSTSTTPMSRDSPRRINLASILLANSHADPKIQALSIPEYVCDGPYALLKSDDPKCTAWRERARTCERMVQSCYDYDSRLTCSPADDYCWKEVWGPLNDLQRNPLDVRMPCDAHNGVSSCYPDFRWVEKWMNSTSTRNALGIDASLAYNFNSAVVYQAFHSYGDSVRNSAQLLPELINDGIRLLVYVGVTDMLCNYIGNEAWFTKLEHRFHAEFKNNTFRPWTTIETGIKAGEVRYAGGGGTTAGNVTFVKVYEAGHMVAHDQPEAAQDLFARWIFDIPLHSTKLSRHSLEDISA